jgi:hypothetical protein
LELTFDRFCRYDELTAILEGFAARHPDLFKVESLGKSHDSSTRARSMSAHASMFRLPSLR